MKPYRVVLKINTNDPDHVVEDGVKRRLDFDEERAKLSAALKALRPLEEKLRTFEGRLVYLDVERQSKRVLTEHGRGPRPVRSPAWYAADILAGIGFVREALARGDGSEAAAYALHVGVILARSVFDAERGGKRKGGHIRGAQQKAERQALKAKLERHVRDWKNSPELQEQFSLSSWVRVKTKLNEKTIRRALKP